ncbi:MAG TPA: acetate--CoA ligase family protein, partial [Acidimicrobiales bacterium]|nr:acetate--CoA ligase family protein [Acidimicrobiales bacterium]
PQLSDEVQQQILRLHPPSASARNPVDLAAGATAEAFARSLEVVLASGEVDAVVVIFTPPLLDLTAAVAQGVVDGVTQAAAGGAQLPVVATFFGAEAGRSVLRSAAKPIPCFTYPETAVRALSHAVSYGAWRSRPQEAPEPPAGTDGNEARRVLLAHDDDGWVTGASAMAALNAYGVRTLPTLEVTSAAAAGTAAIELGWPVALKAIGTGIVHKTELGGVRLGLADAAAVETAYEEMKDSVGLAMQGAVLQPMSAPGIELIAGFTQDPQFGPVVLCGLGGTAVELLGDHSVALAPVTGGEAREMLLGIRASKLLTGHRGSPAVDLDALSDLLVRLSHLADDLPEILEADCNPIVATPDGAWVVDARFRLATEQMEEPDDRRRLR